MVKAVDAVTGHLTKKEIQARKAAEKGLRSNMDFREMAEVKDDPVAHAAFLRVKAVLREIGRTDRLYEAVVNRYCLMTAECERYRLDRENIDNRLIRLEEALEAGEIDHLDYIRLQQKALDQKLALDRTLQAKRKMLLDIEKENCMTIASAIRAVPKKVEDDSADDPMRDMLARRG